MQQSLEDHPSAHMTHQRGLWQGAAPSRSTGLQHHCRGLQKNMLLHRLKEAGMEEDKAKASSCWDIGVLALM